MRKNKWLIYILIAAAGVAGYIAGVLNTAVDQSSFGHIAYALRKTGLSDSYAPSYGLYGYTGFRDSFLQTKFIVENKRDRENLYAEMALTKGWHIAQVTADEYMQFQQTCMWYDLLNVPADVVFDSWYYLETSVPAPYAATCALEGALRGIGVPGYGYEFAVYDVESGLFVFVDLFG